jgi:hypothetical protein
MDFMKIAGTARRRFAMYNTRPTSTRSSRFEEDRRERESLAGAGSAR